MTTNRELQGICCNTNDNLVRKGLAALVGAFVACGGILLLVPPRSFPHDVVLRVPTGATAGAVARTLEAQGAVPHAWIVLASLYLVGGSEARVQAGNYWFAQPVSPLQIAWRLTKGEGGAPSVRVTIPEGLASYEIAEILARAIPSFDKAAFITRAQEEEGFLFPDTYEFSIFATPEEIVETMRQNFDRKTTELRERYRLDDAALRRAVIIASLLEKEAKTSVDRRLIAGVIENRLRVGMPLQIDAVFGYIFRRPTFHPKGEVLDVDSPYNTYRYPGLPPGPIGNPGRAALEDALNPAPSDYLYYLTDPSGTTHYSRNFEEHVAKKIRYLR